MVVHVSPTLGRGHVAVVGASLTQAQWCAGYDPLVRNVHPMLVGLGLFLSGAMVPPNGVPRTMFSTFGQVIEGESEVVNIRDADSRLGPLIFTLIGLGVLTLIATVVFWRLTRPQPVDAWDPVSE